MKIIEASLEAILKAKTHSDNLKKIINDQGNSTIYTREKIALFPEHISKYLINNNMP